MKKILSFILACVLCVAAIPVTAFADTAATDELFGVILDAEGNVVEYLSMPRMDTYVNTVRVIPSGGKVITLQYTTNQSFLFGLATTDVDNKTKITEPNRNFELGIEVSNTLGGGDRKLLNPWVQYDSDGKGIGITCFPEETEYKYCNGVLINESLEPSTVRIIVARNLAYDEVIEW